MRAYWLALALGLAAPARTVAQPVVRVRAETRLEVASEVSPEGVLIHGTLRDDAGAPLPDRTISATLRGEGGSDYIQLHTDAAGEFATRVPAGVQLAELRFETEAFLMSSAATLHVDARRAHVTLHVEAGTGQLSLDEPEHVLTISAESEQGGAGLSLTLSNELGELLAAGVTDASARWTVTLHSSELGSTGVGRLIVRSTADDRRAVAQTEVPIVRSRTTTLTLTDASPIDGGLHVEGSLNTAERPLERRAISVLVNDELAATVLTDLNGHIDAIVAAEGLPNDTYRVALRFDSDAPWLVGSVSNMAIVERSARRWALPLLALFSALVAFALLRWRKVTSAEAELDSAAMAEAGVKLQKAALRATETRVEVSVVRAGTATPLPLARVATNERELAVTDDLGSVAATLTLGTHALTFDAAGYEPLTLRLTVPHRGEWLGATVRLRSRRDIANELMLDAFAPRIPREDWGAATNRELFAKARERGVGSAELLALVDAVEALVYASTPPDSDDLARIRALARQAQPLPR